MMTRVARVMSLSSTLWQVSHLPCKRVHTHTDNGIARSCKRENMSPNQQKNTNLIARRASAQAALQSAAARSHSHDRDGTEVEYCRFVRGQPAPGEPKLWRRRARTVCPCRMGREQTPCSTMTHNTRTIEQKRHLTSKTEDDCAAWPKCEPFIRNATGSVNGQQKCLQRSHASAEQEHATLAEE